MMSLEYPLLQKMPLRKMMPRRVSPRITLLKKRLTMRMAVGGMLLMKL